MKLGETLVPERIVVGGKARDLTEAAAALMRTAGFFPNLQEPEVHELATALAAAESGTMVRVSEHTMLGAVNAPGSEELRAALGVFPDGFMASTPRDGEPALARVLLLFATPRRVASLRAEAFPRLVRALRQGRTVPSLLRATSSEDVVGVTELMDTELLGELKVLDAMSPVSFRIYPDTPLSEIVDLMVRRGVRALPVVGTEYEVLGLITIGDALRHMVPKWMGGDEARSVADDGEDAVARDVMTRSVMGVPEDQTLLDAARIMANKGFEHLPVVRDGELVGLVTEETVLRMLSNR